MADMREETGREEGSTAIPWLPIGSVVELEGRRDEPVCILGYLTRNARTERLSDYMGQPYPLGLITSKRAVLFDADEIERVRFIGYQGAAVDELLDKLDAAKREALDGER